MSRWRFPASPVKLLSYMDSLPNPQLFEKSASLRVRQVELSATDSVQRHREKLARIVLDEMYQFVALLDARGNLLEVNRAALEGGGMRMEDIQGKPFWEARWWAVSREIQGQLQRAIVRAASGEFVRYDVEIYGRSAGRETIIIDFSLFPVRDQRGEVVFLLPEGRNITEKKRAEEEIARKNRELELLLQRVRELDEVKSQLFANVSHELRTPLALILGPAEAMLSQGGNLTERQRRDLAVIRRNASTLLKHVNDLLDVAKMDAGRMSLAYAEVDLAGLVRKVAGHFEALAAERDMTFLVEAPEQLSAQVDVEKVERVVLNLLSNAFKFTPRGGLLKLSVQEAQQGRALLAVQDSGPGVRAELRQSIFERFRQGEGGSTRQFGGTGLGLSIVRDFVELHGGLVSVTDAPGSGALFLVELPCRAPEGTHVRRQPPAGAQVLEADMALRGTLEELAPLEAVRAQAREQAPQGAEERPRVLVVEDNPELNRFLVEALQGEYHVATAFDGQEALEQVHAHRPELILTDLMMPRMSGDELVAAVRREPAFARVPMLVLSAKADEALRLRLLREGVQDYVVKPFSAEEVVARVRNLVQLERARAELERKSEQLQRLQEREVQRQSEAQFRTLAETIPQLVWVARPDGHIEFFNQHWLQYTGLTLEQSRGEGWAECLHPEDRGRTWQVWRRSLETGELYEVECRHRRADGEYRWFLVRAMPVRGSEGRIVKWFGTCTDIHDQKQAQGALEQAVQLRDEFLSVAAHELRTPLTALKLQVDLLGRAAVATWGRLTGALEERVKGMHRQVSRLSALNEALLDVSRLSAGRLHLELEEVELAELVQETVERLRPELERAQCALQAEVEPGLWAHVDRLRLEQVLTNLLTNAARYGVGKPVQVRLGQEQGQAVLSVKDQGIGIQSEDHERIFRRFERAASYHYGGLGLGLYISSRLVEAMGGSIAVDSRLGQGATFTVRLPLRGELGRRAQY